MNILIVEDEHRLADSICEIFTSQKYTCDVVYDGADGLAYGKSGIYDVIAIITYVAQGNVDVGILFYYFFVLGLLILFFLYSVMVWGAANEIETETDRNYVLAVFSGVVSLASLIVAIATFLRG